MKIEYISIAEFAKLAGVSRQTVYNRLDKDLSKFTKIIDGKKQINKKALLLFSADNRNNLDSNETEENADVSNNVSSVSSNLSNLIDSLTKELEIKNKQIELLMQQNEALTDVLKSTQEQLSASQALHAGLLQMQLQSNEIHSNNDDNTIIQADQDCNEQDISPETEPVPEADTGHNTHDQEKNTTGLLSRFINFFR